MFFGRKLLVKPFVLRFYFFSSQVMYLFLRLKNEENYHRMCDILSLLIVRVEKSEYFH